MDRNLILEQDLLEAGRLLKESKKMITLTYSERTYLQQWFYQKTGNRILNRACDIEQALVMFYEVNKPKEVVVDEQIIDEIIENSEVTEKQSTTKKSTTAKTKKIEDNETKESEEADDKL